MRQGPTPLQHRNPNLSVRRIRARPPWVRRWVARLEVGLVGAWGRQAGAATGRSPARVGRRRRRRRGGRTSRPAAPGAPWPPGPALSTAPAVAGPLGILSGALTSSTNLRLPPQGQSRTSTFQTLRIRSAQRTYRSPGSVAPSGSHSPSPGKVATCSSGSPRPGCPGPSGSARRARTNCLRWTPCEAKIPLRQAQGRLRTPCRGCRAQAPARPACAIARAARGRAPPCRRPAAA